MVTELNVWKNRWDALNKVMGELANYYNEDLDDATLPQRMTFSHLVKRLQAFADKQFNFFFDGFETQKKYKLARSMKYPPEYAYTVTLDQIAFDLEVIQRAACQRLSGTSNMKATLLQADKLAWQALQPALTLLPKKPAVVTYFQKSTSIRIIPYAQVALIGIPFSAIYFPVNYLAIPHEVGHYVYRHGRVNGGKTVIEEVSGRLEASPEYVRNWKEEIYADVYGGAIGGPAIALDFQDLQLEKSQKEFTEDKGIHPVPFVRPFIYTKVLEKLELSNSPGKLNTHWDGKLSQRGNPSDFATATGAHSTLEAARSNLHTVIDKLFLPLSDNQFLVPKNPSITWYKDLASGENADTLYPNFDKNHIETNLIPDLELHALGVDPSEVTILTDLWLNWVAENKFLGELEAPPITPEEIEEGTMKEDGAELPGWIHVLNATGWTTRGPSSHT